MLFAEFVYFEDSGYIDSWLEHEARVDPMIA